MILYVCEAMFNEKKENEKIMKNVHAWGFRVDLVRYCLIRPIRSHEPI